MLESLKNFYLTFHNPFWIITLSTALFFPIKKLMYGLYLRKFSKDNPEIKELTDEISKTINRRANITSVLLSLVFSYLYVQNVF